MAVPRIGRDTFKDLPLPTVAESEASVYGMDLSDLELDEPLGRAPDPPKCIQERLRREEKVWRWVSKPTVKYMGMRQYLTVSPTSEERDKIKNGDCPGGVDVDVENKITWREDAWLAAIQRRLHERRVMQKFIRTNDQTKVALSTEQLKEALFISIDSETASPISPAKTFAAWMKKPG